MGPEPDRKPKVLLVCSPGGHLLQLLRLRPAWGDMERAWITLKAPDSDSLLQEEQVILAHGPTNRSISALVINLVLAWRVVRRARPDAILSTGAALAVPFFLIGKLFGARLIFVESLTRTSDLGLSGKLVYPLADAVFVQWPDAARWKRSRFVGGLL